MPAETRGFDYVVVGAGSAGCVVANRLSADPDARVALIEAGASDRSFPLSLKTALPIGNVFLLSDIRYNWNYTYTDPKDNTGREIPCPRGRLFGGCSSVNGTVYMRGHPTDYDDWLAAGNEGWGYADVLAAYKAQENWHGPAPSPYHGTGGELDVGGLRAPNPIAPALVDAARQAGHAPNEDFNGATQDGFGLLPLNQRNGVRLSASRAFLHPALNRRNLTVFADAMVERVDLKGSRAVGLTVVRGGERMSLTASREVILSAGTVNSPQILMLSGIGPEQALRRHGIPVLHDLPGVGRNLHDHPAVTLAVDDPSCTAYALSRRSWPRVAASPLRYAVARSGLLASNAAEAGGFVRTLPGLTRPDVQMTLVVGLKQSARVVPKRHGFVLLVNICRPLGRGHLALRSADPRDPPLLRHGFLDHDADIATLVRGLREARRIVAQPAMSRFVGAEIAPGAELASDEELAAAVRETVATVYHPVGTCRMGPSKDGLAVVDARLRVHGIEGLRVADASIMPSIVGGNTSAPAMMIGERAAAFARAEAEMAVA